MHKGGECTEHRTWQGRRMVEISEEVTRPLTSMNFKTVFEKLFSLE